MNTTPQQKTAKVILFLILLPTAVIAVPVLLLGSIFALAGLHGIITHPFEIIGSIKSIIQPKSALHITPIAVPFGFWGLYTLWAVWDQISHGKLASTLSNVSTHLGMCAGVVSLLSLQGFLHWKALPFYLPLLGVVCYYWLLFKERPQRA